MIPQTDITTGHAEHALALSREALEIRIVDDPTWLQASQYLIDVDKAAKAHEEDVEKVKRPYLDELAKIRATAKTWSDELAARRSNLVKNIQAYEDKRDAAARIEQAKDLKRWEKQVERVEAKAEAKGQPVPVVSPPPVREMVSKTQHVGGASITTVNRKDWKIRDVVVDGAVEPIQPDTLTYADAQRLGLKIPASYFVLDTGKVGRIIRNGGEIPDIDIVTVKSKSISHN
jgi:hypothetical protein